MVKINLCKTVYNQEQKIGDNLEGTDDPEYCLESDVDLECNKDGEETLRSVELGLQERPPSALPVVGVSPSGETVGFIDSSAYKPDEHTMQFEESKQTHVFENEMPEAVPSDVSNDDIRTAHIVNTDEEDVVYFNAEDSLNEGELAEGVSSVLSADHLLSKENRLLTGTVDIHGEMSTAVKAYISKNKPDYDSESNEQCIKEDPDANISVTELRLNTQLPNNMKPLSIETMLENVIISSSFREDDHDKLIKHNKIVKGDCITIEKEDGNEKEKCISEQSVEHATKDGRHEGPENKNEEVSVEKDKIAPRVHQIMNEKEETREFLEEKNLECMKIEDSSVEESSDVDNETAGEILTVGPIAFEEEQREIRISDSYGLVDMTSSLMTEEMNAQEGKAVDEDGSHLVENLLAEIDRCIEKEEFSSAVEVLRRCRGYPDTGETALDGNEKDILMVLFAKHLMKNRVSVVALTNSLENLADVCDQLSECMTELLALICAENEARDE